LKRSIWILWLVFGFYFYSGPAAMADAASQAGRQIQAVYDSQDAAMGRRDLKGAISHVDPSYVWKHTNGSAESRKAWAAEIAAWFAYKMSANYVAMVEKVRMVGPKTAFVVTIHNINFGVMDSKTGVPGDAVSTYTVYDKWVKRAKGWMLIQSFDAGKKHSR
jgi:hypothetical protein